MSARSVAERGFRLLAEGDAGQAAPLLQRAAREGDAAAQVKVAQWRLWGQHGPQDFAAAHKLLLSAAAKGSAEAKTQRAILYANGTGVAADWTRAMGLLQEAAEKDPSAAAQVRLLSQMAIDAQGRPSGGQLVRRKLSDRPHVELIERFWTADECLYLARAGAPNLQPSRVRDGRTGQVSLNPVRTSWHMNFGPPIEDLVIRALNVRIAAASASEVEWGEPLQLLRYSPGEEFKPHFDANQRVATMLVYLNADYAGGETIFTETGLKVRGSMGDALYFRNVDEAGELDPMSRHAGAPVQTGEKWIASRWIRGAPFSLWG